MKTSRPFLKSTILAIACVPLLTLSGRAQILADAAGNYQAGSINSVMTPLVDTHGTGTWTYNSVVVNNDVLPTSISGAATLTYEANTVGGTTPYYGTNGSYANPDSIIDLPAVSNTVIFPDSPAPSDTAHGGPGANFLEVHPSQNTNAADLRWTAGTGETGNLTLTFDLSRVNVGSAGIGPGQGLVDLLILQNGNVLGSYDDLTIGSNTGPISLGLGGVTVGTKVDFVVSSGNGVLGFNLAYLSADIAVPEPSTWALMTLGSLGLALGARRLGWLSRRTA